MHLFMGGTFDPVHKGHVRGALHVSKLFNNAIVHLLPTKIPVHKAAPSTSSAQRLDMLNLVAAQYKNIAVDVREIESACASYTIDTLKQLRSELGASKSLVMVIGMDSFLTLTSWREYEEFFGLCHILVLQRPNYEIESEVERGEQYQLLMQHRAKDAQQLCNSSAGKLLFFEQPTTDVSASEIRMQVGCRQNSDLLPIEVANYIDQHGLYQI
jgi:nicotinate-nucleotide adenylyltransferase